MANYFMWSLAKDFQEFLPTTVMDIFSGIDSLAISKPGSRWQLCLKKAEETMGMALGAIYVREKFDDKDKKEVCNY